MGSCLTKRTQTRHLIGAKCAGNILSTPKVTMNAPYAGRRLHMPDVAVAERSGHWSPDAPNSAQSVRTADGIR